MLNHSEEISNDTVKKILKKQKFYDRVNSLAQLLRPIKNAILLLEENQTNFAGLVFQKHHHLVVFGISFPRISQ